MRGCRLLSLHFFFNDTATTEIYTLSLHDALPIFYNPGASSTAKTVQAPVTFPPAAFACGSAISRDRKSTRLNSSHQIISYAVFSLKKKKLTKSPVPDNRIYSTPQARLTNTLHTRP